MYIESVDIAIEFTDHIRMYLGLSEGVI
jgi:hypothetical protein